MERFLVLMILRRTPKEPRMDIRLTELRLLFPLVETLEILLTRLGFNTPSPMEHKDIVISGTPKPSLQLTQVSKRENLRVRWRITLLDDHVAGFLGSKLVFELWNGPREKDLLLTLERNRRNDWSVRMTAQLATTALPSNVEQAQQAQNVAETYTDAEVFAHLERVLKTFPLPPKKP